MAFLDAKERSEQQSYLHSTRRFDFPCVPPPITAPTTCRCCVGGVGGGYPYHHHQTMPSEFRHGPLQHSVPYDKNSPKGVHAYSIYRSLPKPGSMYSPPSLCKYVVLLDLLLLLLDLLLLLLLFGGVVVCCCC